MKDEASRKPNNLLRLLVYIKPHWPIFAAATACGLIKFLSPTAINWAVGEAINALSDAGHGALSADAAWAKISRLALMGLGILLVSPLFVFLRSALGARAVQEVINRLRCDLYAHIQKLSHAFFDANRSGSLTSRIIGDVEMIQPFIGRAFVQVWMSIGLIAVVLWYFFSQSVFLGLLSLSLIPFQILVQRAIGWKVKENAKAIRDLLSMLSGNIQEKLAASTIVKTFTREEDEVQRFSDESSSLVGLSVSNARLNGISEAFNHALKMAAQLLVISVGGYVALYHGGGISVGLVIQFILMQGQLYMPFEWLNEMQLVIAAALGATDRIFTIIDTEPEVADAPGAKPAPHFVGDILIDTVTFSYPSAASPTLTDFTLHIPARTTTALVGPSGGGKTTVTHLLSRFYEWDTGRVLIDGHEVHNYTVYSLRAQIGLVPQDPILFSGTIEQNILYGRPDATPAEVRRAAEQAYALEFIEALDDGFDTLLGERGIRLSGGQKQRVAIARAFLKDPAILILDEATSALDSESERIVQQALEALMHDRTTIVIAHRLATVIRADQIAVIAAGRVAECGQHDALLERNGLYAMLCRQQFGDQMPGLPVLD